VAAARSFADALRRLGMRPAGGNHDTLRKYVRLWASRPRTSTPPPHAPAVGVEGEMEQVRLHVAGGVARLAGGDRVVARDQ
jgi:hypothetical protein